MSEEIQPQGGQGAQAGGALGAIVAAAAGLLMPSESDYPFAPFRWPGPGPLTPAALLAHLGLPPDTPVATRELASLFRRLAAPGDWHDEREQATAARFAALRDTIAARLAEATVYRVGSTEITVIIAGRDDTGAVVGLSTTVVET